MHWREPQGPLSSDGWSAGFITLVVIGCLTLFWIAVRPAHGHDHSRPSLNGWFDSLRSGKGPCCSNADGTVLSDVDWDSKDGHYRVRIEGEWWDVPDEAVLKQPNEAGPAMVWPMYYRAIGAPVRIEIRCFIVGSMG